MCSLSLSCYLRLQPGEKPVQICDLLAPGFGDAGQAEIQDAVFRGHCLFFFLGGESSVGVIIGQGLLLYGVVGCPMGLDGLI